MSRAEAGKEQVKCKARVGQKHEQGRSRARVQELGRKWL